MLASASAGSRQSATPLHAGSRRSAMPLHCSSGFPDWVLLDTVAHMGRCRDNNNTTTAVAETSAGCPIEVSFVVADPPVLTRCIIDCPHLPWADFFDEPPLIIGADGAFLLISVIFPDRPGRSYQTDLFVYKSGPGAPSLELIPRPYPVGYQCFHIGILSCGDHCLVLVHERRFDAGGRMGYVLHAFSSRTKSWSTKVARLARGMEPKCGRFDPTKAFSVDGGSMAWVDLRNGILLFDSVAEDNPVVRLIQLPPLMLINMNLEVCFDDVPPCLDKVRDVTCSDGWFRFIEMGFPESPLNYRWKASMYKRRVHPDDGGEWCHCGTIDSANLSPEKSCFPYLFPDMYKENKLALNDVISSYPTLDQNCDDVVYMVAKMEVDDPNGWLLAVNTKRNKLQKIVPFPAETFQLIRSYMQCAFSKHLSRTSGACNTNAWKHKLSKEDWMPLVLCVISILSVQQKFRQFEKYFTKGRPSRTEVCSLLHAGVASSSNVHIHQVAHYATNIGLGKAASDAENTFQQAAKDVENLLLGYDWNDPSVCGKAVGDKINVAVGALDKLLHTLPSCVLHIGRSMISVNESVNEDNIAEKLQ